MRKYKPATFQPTVRPDWGGILSYIPLEEKAEILEAIIKYPTKEISSQFWLDTIKPDLDLQYEEFTRQCEAKSRGIRNRWGKTSITPLIDENNTSNTDVIVSEGIGLDESKRIEERIGIVEKENKKEKKYRFERKVIKLTDKDFTDWEKAFPDLNLYAELIVRDDFLSTRPIDEQKKWYISTSAYFIKENERRKKQHEENEIEYKF